jgi:hypothetical protein
MGSGVRLAQSETPVPLKIPFETLRGKGSRYRRKASLRTDRKKHRQQGSETRRQFGLLEAQSLSYIRDLSRDGGRSLPKPVSGDGFPAIREKIREIARNSPIWLESAAGKGWHISKIVGQFPKQANREINRGFRETPTKNRQLILALSCRDRFRWSWAIFVGAAMPSTRVVMIPLPASYRAGVFAHDKITRYFLSSHLIYNFIRDCLASSSSGRVTSYASPSFDPELLERRHVDNLERSAIRQ